MDYYSNYGGTNLSYGERSGAQRALKVLAILYTIGGVLVLLALLFVWYIYSQANAEAGGTLATQLVQELKTRGITMTEAEVTSLFSFAIRVLAVFGLALLLTGILGIRAANDPGKVMPYLVVSGIMLALTILNTMRSILDHTFALSIETLIGVGIPVLAVWLGVSVKQQRDQARMSGAQW